jgi:hypothetical protein
MPVGGGEQIGQRIDVELLPASANVRLAGLSQVLPDFPIVVHLVKIAVVIGNYLSGQAVVFQEFPAMTGGVLADIAEASRLPTRELAV